MNQTDHRDQRRGQFEDEIELIDYLRVMWKWKWMIIGGTLLCALAIAIYGFTRPVEQMYKVSTLIEIDPKVLGDVSELNWDYLREKGRYVEKLGPVDKIKFLIDYGIFDGIRTAGRINPVETFAGGGDADPRKHPIVQAVSAGQGQGGFRSHDTRLVQIEGLAEPMCQTDYLERIVHQGFFGGNEHDIACIGSRADSGFDAVHAQCDLVPRRGTDMSIFRDGQAAQVGGLVHGPRGAGVNGLGGRAGPNRQNER